MRGFTLIELMVTIAIVAIVAALAAPNFSAFLDRSRTETSASILYTALLTARSEAVKRNQEVTIRANTAGNFESGWTIFADNDGDGVLDGGEESIRTQSAFSDDITARITGISYITFSANGTAVNSSGSNQSRFNVCGRSGVTSDGYLLGVQATGRAHKEKGATSCP